MSLPKPKTSDVLKALDLVHRRKVRQDQEGHESKKALVRALCDAGLVDDVEPDPGAEPGIPEIICAACGRLIPAPLLSCPLCEEEAEKIEW